MYAGQVKEAKPRGEGELWTKSLQGAESGR